MIFLVDFEKTLANDNNIIDFTSINIINRLSANNKICIVSYSKFSILNSIVENNNLLCDFISLEDCKGKINNDLYVNKIDVNIVSEIINSYKDFIYTAYSNDGFIYKYQERLVFLYPKNYTEDFISLGSLYVSFYNECDLVNCLEKYGLLYEIIAKDKNKTLIKITKSLTNKASVYLLYKSLFPKEKFVGISDSINDFDMLSKCDYKIAMLNGDNDLKNKADTITQYDNNHNGCMLELDNIAKLQQI